MAQSLHPHYARTLLRAAPECLVVLLQLQEVLLQLADPGAQLLGLSCALLLLTALLRQHEDDLRVPPWALSQPCSPSSALTRAHPIAQRGQPSPWWPAPSLDSSCTEPPAAQGWPPLQQVMGALNQIKTRGVPSTLGPP